jgi:glycosyltransferase involved in cell wall biosynthesis
MRILTLSWEYPPHVVGGMGRHVTELVAGLAGRGFEVHVVTPQLRGGRKLETSRAGVHIRRIAAPSMEDYGYVSFVSQTNAVLERAARELQEEVGEIALIHAHDWLTASAAIGLKHAWRRPLIATIHATERGRQQGNIPNSMSDQINSLEWWLTYESWRVITCSHFMARQVGSYFNTPADKVDVVPNGVHVLPSPFRKKGERCAFRRRFVADSNPLVFYVGRVVYEKGVHVLIDAWQYVRETLPKARLVIAGTGDYLDQVKQQARILGVSDSITFAGFIADADRDRLFRVADLATFPSLYEPFGIVALEAMAAGCPVVVASTGGLSEVVHLHETGLTVYPNDARSLAWGILQTLQNPDWAQRRAENALREARDLYSWPQIAEATGTIYERTFADWRRESWGAELAPI